jgi:hypothetical protein
LIATYDLKLFVANQKFAKENRANIIKYTRLAESANQKNVVLFVLKKCGFAEFLMVRK